MYVSKRQDTPLLPHYHSCMSSTELRPLFTPPLITGD